jgi:hypothetical protein
MKGNTVVTGVFSYIDDLLKVIEEAKQAGWEYTVYAPCPNHEIEEAASPAKSPVRFVTFTGAFIGLCSGFGLAVWTSLDYPMRTSAKDIVSPPGFVVAGYEWTILFGALSTLMAMFFFGRFPTIFRSPGYDKRFSQTKFGIVVGCDSSEVEKIGSKLSSSGAEEVKVSEGL